MPERNASGHFIKHVIPTAVPATKIISTEEDCEKRADKKALESARKTAAARARWESVKEDREIWIRPFSELPLEAALPYLENLRGITEEGSKILNERINSEKDIRCAGPRCGKDVSGLRPNGNPKWFTAPVFRDAKNPQIQRRLYFCQELCYNEFVRKGDGALGSTAK